MITFGTTYPIGLDISDLSIKLVQLTKQRKKSLAKETHINIQALGRRSLEPGLIENGDIKNIDELAKQIRNLVDNIKFGKVNSDNVVASLPETKTFIKLIEIKNSPNEMSNIIEVEIEKHVPMMLSEIYYDWQIISEDNESKMVLIGVAPKKIVNQYTELFDKAKLSVSALEIEPVAICRSIFLEESKGFTGPFDKNYVVIDIGASRTNMIFYSKNTILFTINIPISGEGITLDIADNLVIEKEQAEKVKIICGLDKNKVKGIINKLLSSTINDLSGKVKEALDFYNNYFSDRGAINKIFLCGGGSNIKGLDIIIKEATSIEVAEGDPLVNILSDDAILKMLSETHNLSLDLNKVTKTKNSKKKKINNSKKISITQDSRSSFATAIGLALRGVYLSDL